MYLGASGPDSIFFLRVAMKKAFSNDVHHTSRMIPLNIL